VTGRASAGDPLVDPLVDTFGRIHDDLRISITDRCNLRCVYCMEEDVTFMERDEVLTFSEIERVASVARRLGVTAVRLTGGEPLVRRSVVELVRRIAGLGFTDLSMTTNGVHLPRLAPALRDAGLMRVNISCDSLRPERFPLIRRRGSLDQALAAMDAAESAGLSPVRVNVVLMAGVNDDEVLDFADFARRTGRTVRFIEFMPLDSGGHWSRDRLVPGDAVVRTITERWPLEPCSPHGDPAPAERFRFVDGAGEIGVISTVTRPFCGSCNRLRLTADGALRNCLFSDDELSARDLMRRGGSDAELAQLIRSCVAHKLPGHGINNPVFIRPRRSMSMIGG
jgi:cyclic pyranopterin phosphate synthase